MSHCLNPKCFNPNDPINKYGIICIHCGENLLLQKQYRIIRRMGTGGFARTFEVESQDNTKSIKVVKILNLSRYDNFDQKERDKKEKIIKLFKREAEVLNRLNHPGIPKVDDGYFEFEFKNGSEPLHCLIMEKIDGVNLQQWLDERNNQPIDFELAREWLKQITLILEQVHAHGFFHRDIKPANIMLRPNGQLVLIDFGAVRDLADTFLQFDSTDARGTCIGSVGYAPPEQYLHGLAVQQSDFFALGRTFVHLLTGVPPCDISDIQKSSHFNWRQYLPVKNNSRSSVISKFRTKLMCDLLDSMMEHDWEKRPKNTRVIIASLNRKTPIPRIYKKIIYVATFFLVGLISSYWYATGVNGCEKIWIRRFNLNDKMSCGEEIMMLNSIDKDKQDGVNAFAAGKYSDSIKLLEKSLQARQDPESFIYLNNARLKANNYKTLTIAIVAPISDSNNDTINSSREMLQGVAQAQNEFNQKHQSQKIGLHVLIASDNNKPQDALKIAQALGKLIDVVAVIGHFRSETTLAAQTAYQEAKLLLISSTATSDDLSNTCPQQEHNCFFRVVSSNSVTSTVLANYLNIAQKRRLAVFYNPSSNYSKSLLEKLRDSFTKLNGEIVAEISLSDNIESNINQVKQKGADAIVLFPTTDGLTSDAAVQVIEYANQFNYLVVGGDSLDNSKIIRKLALNNIGSAIALPWYSGIPSDFNTQADQLWKKRISWHTALTYDATKALIAAFDKQNFNTSYIRSNLSKYLANPNFALIGATGEISFTPNGNRKQQSVHIVKIRLNPLTGKTEFKSGT
ncbi:serine/threonine kinase [Calothrix sp. NIES-4071]|nr:serine/threonine kinase [Calothrix sp. NIES-4071]BAZ62245.1 serine/threonine kinase [Calothrix sp. NIES-4105]